MIQTAHINRLADHLFRHEAGRMVAFLTRIFGTENLELAEDVVQDTLLSAMQTWAFKGIPDNPSAWLFRAARNKAIDVVRHKRHTVPVDFYADEAPFDNYPNLVSENDFYDEAQISDDLLQMMFACCDPGISVENQITLILKTLCGFSTAEIARAFVIPEDTVSKRLYRTKEFFRQRRVRLMIPAGNELKRRTDAVLNAIYLLFNEGYHSTNAEEVIRRDLILEAMRLCQLITQHKLTRQPEAFALMALICFHTARCDGRLDEDGGIILLVDQDRGRWDKDMIQLGISYLNLSAAGDTMSAYHLEAAIAHEHCTSPDFERTNWEQILLYYDFLLELTPSPFIELNRAIVIMQIAGACEALVTLKARITGNNLKKMEGYYLYHALSGEIYSNLKAVAEARTCFETAMKLTRSPAEVKLLAAKMAALNI